MSYHTINYQVSERILTLTLNRPKQLNAFNAQMAQELIEAFDRASHDDEVAAIVVTGAGGAFCAGADLDLNNEGNIFGLNETLEPSLNDMHQHLDDAEFMDGVRDTGGLVTLAIYNCNKPVIAAINGAAVGIGATMTCAMDIRLASHKARIGFVFNKLGVVPEACSSWFLPRIVGVSQALEWTYSGEIISAQNAQKSGFVKSVLPGGELLEAAYQIARGIAKHSPVAIALTRQMIYRNSAQPDPLEAHKIESLAIFYTSKKDGQEGVSAFFEKRPAKFTSNTSSDMPAFYPWWE